VRRHLGVYQPSFALHYYRVHGLGTAGPEADLVEGTIKLTVAGQQRLCVAEGHGPVDALSHALASALLPHYPALVDLHLIDFKVRVVNPKEGTAARVRVVIECRDKTDVWGTVGVSENIIEASWLALVEGVEYALLSVETPAAPAAPAARAAK